MIKYFLIYKPFNILSQFTDEGNLKGLKSVFDLPNDVYPVGRLDADSEGLLLITNDKGLNNKLLLPENEHKRVYAIQVDGEITSNALQQLVKGVFISINGKKYLTRKAEAIKIEEPNLPPREPPIRYRKNIPTSWILLTLTEGKNRQVRKMTAAVGFPTLRLVRVKIGNLTIENPVSGQVVELEREFVYKNI